MTEIAIKLPLPMSVSGSLLNLIGAAWPDAQLADGSGGMFGDRHMVIRIPDTAPVAVTDEQVAAARVEPGEEDLDITELGPAGISVRRPEHLSAMMLEILLASFEEHPDAMNYLENEVIDPKTGNRYILTFARSAQQTPDALRRAAEQRLETARSDVRRELIQSVLEVQAKDQAGSFSEGVQACLNALESDVR